jgi:hypothetical protein
MIKDNSRAAAASPYNVRDSIIDDSIMDETQLGSMSSIKAGKGYVNAILKRKQVNNSLYAS